MTPSRAKELLPIIQAYAEGKTIQNGTWSISSGQAPQWVDNLDPTWMDDTHFRVKPSPVLLPWRAEDVPPVCWVRFKKDIPGGRIYSLILSVGPHDVVKGDSNICCPYETLMANYEHSTDLKTWLPCGRVQG